MGLANESYQAPSHGILTLVPSSWVPYLELARIDKPIEKGITYAPFLLGSLFAACIARPLPEPMAIITTNAVLFAISFLLHSAGCTWNDIIDSDLDKKVERCRFRPVARGAVSPCESYIFFATQLILCLGILWQTCRQGMPYAILYITLGLIYPYAKRFTNYPQLLLGLTIAWGLIIGFVSIPINFQILGSNKASALGCLFTSQVTWAVIGDTIYALQDADDDPKAGVKSMAVTYRDSLKVLLSFEVMVHVVALILAGNSMGAGIFYFLVAGGGNAAVLTLIVWKVDTSNPKECGWWFRNGNWLVGGSFSAGLLGEYVTRLAI